MHSVTVQLLPSKEAFYPHCCPQGKIHVEIHPRVTSNLLFPGLYLQPLLTVGCIPSLTACGFPGGQFIPHGPLPSKLTLSQPASVVSSPSPGHKKKKLLHCPWNNFSLWNADCLFLLRIKHLQHAVYVVKARHHTVHYKIDFPPPAVSEWDWNRWNITGLQLSHDSQITHLLRIPVELTFMSWTSVIECFDNFDFVLISDSQLHKKSGLFGSYNIIAYKKTQQYSRLIINSLFISPIFNTN